MGALASAWQSRTSQQIQVALTNPDAEGATTVNATVLAAAETDAVADFYLRTGVVFDTTQALHLTVGRFGVTWFLYSFRALPRSAAAGAALDDWDRECGKVARLVGALAWGAPLTDSTLQPSTDADVPDRPMFDQENWDLVPPPPSGTRSTDPDRFVP